MNNMVYKMSENIDHWPIQFSKLKVLHYIACFAWPMAKTERYLVYYQDKEKQQ